MQMPTHLARDGPVIAIMIPVPDTFLLLHIGSGHRRKGGFVCVHACVYACVRSVSVLSSSPFYLLKTKSVIFLCAHLVNKKARGNEAQGEFHVLLFKKSKSVIQNMCEMHNAPRGKASQDAATARVRPRIGRNNGRQIKTPKECMRGKARTQCMACVCAPSPHEHPCAHSHDHFSNPRGSRHRR